MLDIGWPELFVIGLVTLLVVGPKELPKVLRTVSTLMRRARSLASEFQRGVDEMIRESELSELKKGLTDATDPSIIERFADEVDGDRSIRSALEPADELKAPITGKTGKAPPHSVTPPADPFAKAAAPAPSAETPADGSAAGDAPAPRQDEGDDGQGRNAAPPTVSGGASASG